MKRKDIIKALEAKKLTEFQTRVLLACSRIPSGSVRTYKQIAKMAGHPNAYRAVGSVMRINPMAPTIPCHRVVRSDGTIGNYSAKGGAKKKEAMLKAERAI